MVVRHEDIADDSFQVTEIDNHSVLRCTFDCNFNLIGVSVQWTAFDMTWQEMSAVHVLDHAKFHERENSTGKRWQGGRRLAPPTWSHCIGIDIDTGRTVSP